MLRKNFPGRKNNRRITALENLKIALTRRENEIADMIKFERKQGDIDSHKTIIRNLIKAISNTEKKKL